MRFCSEAIAYLSAKHLGFDCFIEVNKKFMLFYLGFNEEELMSAGTELKKSYIKSKDGSKLWIKNFKCSCQG